MKFLAQLFNNCSGWNGGACIFRLKSQSSAYQALFFVHTTYSGGMHEKSKGTFKTEVLGAWSSAQRKYGKWMWQ